MLKIDYPKLLLCPSCSLDQAHRSHRIGTKERIFSWIGRHPYRCHGCGFRFYPGSRARSVEATTVQKAVKASGKSAGSKSASSEWNRALREFRRNQRSSDRREFLLYGLALLGFLAFLWYITKEDDSRAAE